MSYFFLLLKLIKIPEIIACLVAITVKEFSKGFISSKLGDPMPKRDNMITLNPIKYIEPLGFILMVIYGYGWSKTVETTTLYYNNRKRDTFITHFMPIVINIITGIFFIIILQLFLKFTAYNYNKKINNELFIFIYLVLGKTIIMNFRFAIINLIPISPFEGSKILKLFLKPNTVIKFNSIEKIYLIIFVILILMGIVGNILDSIIKILTFSYVNYF